MLRLDKLGGDRDPLFDRPDTNITNSWEEKMISTNKDFVKFSVLFRHSIVALHYVRFVNWVVVVVKWSVSLPRQSEFETP